MCQTSNTLRIALPITRPFVQPTSAVRSVRKLQPFRQPLGLGGLARGPVHLVLHSRAPRGRADEARRALHRSGRPNLPRPQPSGARPVTSSSDPAGRCRAGGSPPVSAARTPLPAAAGRQQGSGSAGAQGPGYARRLRPPWFRRSAAAAPAPTALWPQRLSVRRRRSWGEKREATEDAAGDRTAKRAPAAGGPVAR